MTAVPMTHICLLYTSEGEMYLFGKKVDFKGPKDAQAAGIAAVYQHPTSYPHLTVAENIFMGHEIKKNHMIQWLSLIHI